MEKDIIDINDYNPSVVSEYSKFLFGKAIKINDTKSQIIGVIDSSGSMSSCWPTLVDEWNKLVMDNFENVTTIIFASSATVIKEKVLAKNQVGGGTEIIKGFEAAYTEIIKLSEKEKDFTIIFVSDGEDNDMNTIGERLKKLTSPDGVNINLICIGIGSGFPTFVGMELREKYHSGLSSIPAVFQVSEFRTEIESTLTSIKNEFISKLDKIKVDPPVKRFPWDESFVEEIFESSNFVSIYSSVTFDNKNKLTVTTESAYELSKSQLENIFKDWTQELQIKSLKTSVRNESKIAVEFMEFLYQNYESRTSNKTSDKKTLTVLERLELREDKSGTHLLQSLIGECKRMRDGNSLKDLSSEEAAKRLAIGTKQGKFHSKALQMRGLDQSDYEKFKKEFLEKLNKVKLNPETSQEASFILLQSQKEVFMETTLATAIQKCNSYELVEVMPMVGQTLLIRRTDQSMINPYTIQVLSIPRINKVCDTISLVSQGNQMEISIGNDEEEKFNAVLPLFDKTDEDLTPLLRSKLYHLLMTFNVMGNVDTFFYEAYMGLLANTFIRLLKYPDSHWKYSMIDSIHSTTEMVYGGNPQFEFSLDFLLRDPRGAMVTEHKTERHKCEDMSKMMLNLLILQRRGKVNEEQCQQIIKYILVEHCGRMIKEGTNVFEVCIGEELQDFRFRIEKDDKGFKKTKDESDDTDDKTTTDKKNLQENTQQVSNQVEDINSYNLNSTTNVIHIQSDNLIDVNSVQSVNILNPPQEEDTLDQIVANFIKNREHLKFDSIKDLKTNLKKMFLEFTQKSKKVNNMSIRIIKETFNNRNYRINFDLFYRLQELFCPNLQFDNRNFLIAINHALIHRSSDERCQNELKEDYDKIKFDQKKKFFEKSDKEDKESLYLAFESPIMSSYLADFKNAMKLVRDLNCSTDILKTFAKYDSDKPHVNVIFFGPYHSGKSSIVGRLLTQSNSICPVKFDYYKAAYKHFYANRENPPYEWLSNTAVDERCKDRTLYINVSHLNLNNKFINLYDTPGKYQYYNLTLNAMSLVDHFFLCLEMNLEKIKEEHEILGASFASLMTNNCKKIYVLLTKCDNYIQHDENVYLLDEEINNIKHFFNDLLEKLKIKNIQIEFLPISSYTGLNMDKLANLLDNLNKNNSNVIQFKECQSKLLILDTIDDHFVSRVAYAQVFGNNLKNDSKFIAYPSLEVGKIINIRVNYNQVEDSVQHGQFCSIEFDKNIRILRIERNSIIHVGQETEPVIKDNNKKNSKKSDIAKIKEIKLENMKWLASTRFRINSCVKLEFKSFTKNFQVIEILDKEGIKVEELTDRSQTYTVTFIPTHNVYFERLWNDEKCTTIIIRGKHFKVAGIGKILNIEYNFD